MPKEKESVREFLSRMVLKYPGVFRADHSVLYCVYCHCNVTGNKLFNVKQHMDTKKHAEAAQRRAAHATVQTLLTDRQQQVLNAFNMDMCKAFIGANIPIYKAGHPDVVQFLEKYTTNAVPSESTLRQKYVPVLYNETIENLRQKAENKHIWVSIDETTDAEQRMVANFVFGLMEGVEDESSPEHGKCYLLNMVEVDAANANNMAAFFNDSLALLWPQSKCIF